MTDPAAPATRPANPNFSSGPCAKHPGWSLDALKGAALARSHRAKVGKQKLKEAIDLTRAPDGSVILRDARFTDPRVGDRFSLALPDVVCEPLP